MPYQRYKTGNGVPVDPKKVITHEAYIARVKKYFLTILGIGITVFITGIILIQTYGVSFASLAHEEFLTALYKLELSSYTNKNSIAIAGENDLPAESVTVINYHGVLPAHDESNINTTIDNFKDQMFALKKAGYTTIDTEQLYKFLKGEIELPKRSVMITFDDGRYDTYIHANPIFKATGFKAPMFIISGFSLTGTKKESYYIQEEDIRRMARSGYWDIQAHTDHGHELYPIDNRNNGAPFFSGLLWLPEQNRLETDAEFKTRVSEDMDRVKNGIERLLNKRVSAFAIPFGDYGQRHSNPNSRQKIVLDEANKRFVLLMRQDSSDERFTSNYRIDKNKPNNMFLVRRLVVEFDWRGDDVLKVLKQSEAKNLPYMENFSNKNNWISSWGVLTVDSSPEKYNNNMILSSGKDLAGAATILDGSRAWQDYLVQTQMTVPNKNSAFIWVRYQNDDNNAGCNLGNGFIHIEQMVNGKQRVIKGFRDPEIQVPSGQFEFDVSVKGRHVACIVNGRVLIETDFLDTSLDKGGIGFKTWDNIPGQGVLIIKKVEVLPM
jgi:peptidoglycan/xylan/chitin deacetylase (PgdA/CDA1 family)